jgi:hypothetical protein
VREKAEEGKGVSAENRKGAGSRLAVVCLALVGLSFPLAAFGVPDRAPESARTDVPTVVVAADPESLTAAEPVKTVSVEYLGGGSGLLYGYSVRFAWDGLIVSTGTAQVSEGDLLSDQGPTRFYRNVSGPNEITVDCVLLGDQPGVAGPGTMFTIGFTGLAVGTSPVDVTVISARDRNNNDLTGFDEDDGELIVDVSAPIVSDVRIENVTLLHTDDFIKDTDAARVTATVVDDEPSFGIGGISANLEALGGGASTIPDSYTSNVATWTLGTAACVPADGIVTVVVTATDPIGNVGEESDDILADNTAPGAITDFDASPHHERVSMVWSDPSGLDANYYGVLVRYDGGGSYPEYATLGTFPSDPDGGDGEAIDQTGIVTGGDHGIATRDIYYYTAFAYDWALNFGPAASTARDRATNYWLGDVDANTGPGGWDFDGDVDFDDISAFSAAYWMTGPLWPYSECNVGPTDTGGPFGVPAPDDRVNFEDLMVFALNFQVVTPAMKTRVLLAGGSETAPASFEVLDTGATVPGEERDLPLLLRGNEGTVKGASILVRYDRTALSFLGLAPCDAFASGGVLVFTETPAPGEIRFDWAVLGDGRAVEGSGEIAFLRFLSLGESRTPVRIDEALARDVANLPLTVDLSPLGPDAHGTTPSSTRLAGARPNPFNPSTVVRVDLARPERLRIAVYDARGRLVRVLVDEERPAGSQEAAWDGTDETGAAVGSGTYLVRAEAGLYRASTKVMLVK